MLIAVLLYALFLDETNDMSVINFTAANAVEPLGEEYKLYGYEPMCEGDLDIEAELSVAKSSTGMYYSVE
ncbi:MAG: hypothetical protein LBM93_01675 [Oscillospiraceae bacterium]|jgi:hypothetical protein|nr:hypothetical protein [Oscillospiraceae bacterium]